MRAAGAVFESRACAELEGAGLKLLAHNYATRYGELDLVMREGDTIVFVEVRYRRNAAYGDAVASVTANKQARVLKAAELWLATHSRWARCDCRFDVIAYSGPEESPKMAWIRGAFENWLA